MSITKISLKEMQQQEFEILCELDRICTAYKITYYLTAGTLLGAIRHKGFIPWDDDIDVAMPLKDYRKFTQICQRELATDYFFQDWKTEKNYPFHFAKIRKNGTNDGVTFLQKIEMHHGISIDIFPLEACPKRDWFAKLLFKITEFSTYALLKKGDKTFSHCFQKKYERIIFRLLQWVPKKGLLFFREGVCRIVSIFCSNQRLCTSGGGHGYPYETYKAEWFSKTVFVTFENRTFPAPKEWDALLSHMYGDYQILPPKEKRRGHIEEHFDKIGKENKKK